jgi:carboxypeptidase family protein
MRKPYERAITLAIGFGVFAVGAPATRSQTTHVAATLKGRVVEAGTNKPIKDATVIVTNQSTGRPREGRTHPDGGYWITLLKSGRYTITAACTGACRGYRPVPLLTIVRDFSIENKDNIIELPRISLEKVITKVGSQTPTSNTAVERRALRVALNNRQKPPKLAIAATPISNPERLAPEEPIGKLNGTGLILVDGIVAQIGTTIHAQNANRTDTTIGTGPDSKATIDLGTLGAIELRANSSIRLGFARGDVDIFVEPCSAVVQSVPRGVTGHLIYEGQGQIEVNVGEIEIRTSLGSRTLNAGQSGRLDLDGKATITGEAQVTVRGEHDFFECDSGAGQLANTTNGSRGGNFGPRQLPYLPLPGIRSIDDLAFLLPGVAPAPQAVGGTVGPGIGPGVGTSGQFSVNGLRSRSNNFTIDGSDNNDEDVGVRRQGFTSLTPQSIESLQEFQITTLLPEPQYGRNMGAQVKAISRSGGSAYHGTLYGFLIDNHLRARDFFDLKGGPPSFTLTRASDGVAVKLDGADLKRANPVGGQDSFTRVQDGFVFGGPLFKYGSDRPFFFVSFEHQDTDVTRESHFAVPTVAERGLFGSGDTGFHSVEFDNTGAPLQSQPTFPTSSAGDAFFSLFPFPNNPAGPYGANTFTEVLPASAHGKVFSVRLDQSLSKLHTLAARYNFTSDNTILPVTGDALFSTLLARVRTQNLSLVLDSVLSYDLANQARVSYGRTKLGFDEVRDPFLQPSTAFPRVPFLLNAPLVVNATLPGTAPQFFTRGQVCAPLRCPTSTEGITGPIGQVIVSGYSPLGADVFNFPQGRTDNTFQYADTLFYKTEKSVLTAGFDLHRVQLNSFLDRNFRPVAVFAGAPDISRFYAKKLGFRKFNSAGFFQGRDFVAAGAPTGFFQTQALVPDSTIGLRYWHNSFFLADQIQLWPRVLITLGIRYERNSIPSEVNRRIESSFASADVREYIDLEKTLEKKLNPNNPKGSGLEQYLAGRTRIFQTDANNFAPHIAFAWDPKGKGKSSIRGGYGIYYDQIVGSVISQSRNVFPNFINVNLSGRRPTGSSDIRNLFFARNPALLAVSGTLNSYDANRFGSPAGFLLNTNSLLLGILPQVPPLPKCPPLTPCTFEPRPELFFFDGPGFVLPAFDLQTPFSHHWGLTLEMEIKNDFLISVAYVGTKGSHLLRSSTPNLGPNATPVITAVKHRSFEPVFEGFDVPPARPFPFLGSIASIESDAESTYHSFQLQSNKRFTKGIQYTMAYTWSHAIDSVSDLFGLAGAPALAQNSLDLHAERGDANFDVRHRFVYSVIWDLTSVSRYSFLRGLQIASIGTFQTGQPYTVLACCDVNIDGNITDRLKTADGVREVHQGTVRLSFSSDPFSLLSSAGSDGSVGRNTFRASGIATVNLLVNKIFSVRESQKFEVRTELFNVFNRTHFGIPVHQIGFPGLGRSVDTRIPGLTVQFAIKYSL